MNYYNEHDPFAAAWLRELISEGAIPAGHVDERDVRDVVPSELGGYRQCHFFAGIGGWCEALRLAGLADVPGVWTGSCPCQPFSAASRGRGRGFGDEKDLWPSWRFLVAQCRPKALFGEQVAGGLGWQWLDRTTNDLECENFTVWAVGLCASLFGFPGRERIYFAAYADGKSQCDVRVDAKMACLSSSADVVVHARNELFDLRAGGDGVRKKMAQLRAYGNAVIPKVAAEFLRSALDDLAGSQ